MRHFQRLSALSILFLGFGLSGCATQFCWYRPERSEPAFQVVAAELQQEGAKTELHAYVRYQNGDVMRVVAELGKKASSRFDPETPVEPPEGIAGSWQKAGNLIVGLNTYGTLLLVKQGDAETRYSLPQHYSVSPYGWDLIWRVPATPIGVAIDVATFPFQLISHLMHGGEEEDPANPAREDTAPEDFRD